LRNVLIYFEPAVRARVVTRICERLTPGGLLLVGSAETLAGLGTGLERLRPAIYRWPQEGPS
jgi:chemotaxis protein methyltransferase CheR